MVEAMPPILPAIEEDDGGQPVQPGWHRNKGE
jgi:hypothetical protein